MDGEKRDSFLTCMEACDTIMLFSQVDNRAIVENIPAIAMAMQDIWNTDMDEVPDSLKYYVLKVKGAIAEFVGLADTLPDRSKTVA